MKEYVGFDHKEGDEGNPYDCMKSAAVCAKDARELQDSINKISDCEEKLKDRGMTIDLDAIRTAGVGMVDCDSYQIFLDSILGDVK
jgi:hypothetical protein